VRYEGQIYRPPSEWQSYLLQVTIGCSHNACTFCGMFKDKTYRQRPMEEILEDIDLARKTYPHVEQVFLCDGDAISLPTEDLLRILHKLKETFPELREVATYAGPRSTLAKSPSELRALYEAGLCKAYLGVESGSDAVLKRTCKGVTAAQMAQAGKLLVQAGMELYAIILLGLAGKEDSLDHARQSAALLNEIRPAHVPAMTYMPVPGTPMYRDIEQGKFQVLTPQEILLETAELVQHIDVPGLHFTSSHASNYVPIEGTLPQDREAILAQLRLASQSPPPQRARGL
jgi:radical SAM superfamily enzyme YgiQ (UPF0313 family)